MKKSLSDIRIEIDAVDDSIARALVKRAELAKEVRAVKQGEDILTYHPARERQILDRVFSICKDTGFAQKQVEKVFLSVLSACRSIVGDIEVCIAGSLGGINHAAVFTQFGPIDRVCVTANVEEVFRRVEDGSSHYGIIPVSRNEDGILSESLFGFLNSSQTITTEVDVQNNCSLFSNSKKIEDIKEVFVEVGLSSTLNISKLKTFLAEDAIIHPYAGEKELRELELDNQAVLAPSILSSYITLPVLVDNLDLSSSIRTRFFVVGPPEVNQEKHNVTALVCVVKERSGALREILEPFEKLDLTLLALESRTSKGKKWECVFYLEFESLGRDQDVSDLVTQLESKCLFVKKLGSFHREL